MFIPFPKPQTVSDSCHFCNSIQGKESKGLTSAGDSTKGAVAPLHLSLSLKRFRNISLFRKALKLTANSMQSTQGSGESRKMAGMLNHRALGDAIVIYFDCGELLVALSPYQTFP